MSYDNVLLTKVQFYNAGNYSDKDTQQVVQWLKKLASDLETDKGKYASTMTCRCFRPNTGG
jgi:hypothetical protein